MEANKVVYGDNTLIDLTNDTVTPEALAAGVTAHDASGQQITGEAEIMPDLIQIERGGTGATTAEEACANLGVADYIVDCEYNEGEVEITKTNEAGETVTETITAVTSWYERYASGKVRQGGIEAGKFTFNENQYLCESTVTLIVPMANNIYSADQCKFNFTGDEVMYLPYNPRNPTTTTLGVMTDTERDIVNWKVEGMGAKL